MRLACVFVPQLALQAALRRCPELRGTPVALVKTKTGRASDKVVTVSAEAQRASVRTGLTAAQAAAMCPGLTLLPLAEADIAATEAALSDLGFAFASRIDREPGRVFFEIGDLGHLYPSEAAVTQAIQARALRVGLGVRVAIAARKAIARVATRAAERAVVPTGHEAAFLAPLPLRVLDEPLLVPDQTRGNPASSARRVSSREGLGTLPGFPFETRGNPASSARRVPSREGLGTLPGFPFEIFQRWGLKTVGALAKLPAADVGLRLGADGARLHRLARGEDDEPFLPALPADAVEEGIDLDDAIAELEPLAFVLRGLFDRVLARLGCRGLACAGITLRFQLETRSFDVREVNLAAPTREGAPLLQLTRLDLTRRPPDAPIVAVLVVARPARARTAQLDFLRPAGPAPDRLAATIARLAALCGPDNVGVPRAEDTWREEAVGVAAFALDSMNGSPMPARATSTDAGARALAIRRYRPPEEIEVMLGPDGPSALRGKETTARILIAAGPYRLSGEWWRPGEHSASDAARVDGAAGPNSADRMGDIENPGGFSRDYWDVHASDGALYRLHHDRHRDRWYLDGYYD